MYPEQQNIIQRQILDTQQRTIKELTEEIKQQDLPSGITSSKLHGYELYNADVDAERYANAGASVIVN